VRLPDAVVFDLDGVLVNSEEVAWAAWGRALAQHGYELTAEDRLLQTGETREGNLAYFGERAAIAELEPFEAALGHDMRAAFAAHLVAYDDARRLLEALEARDVPIAVASNGGREGVEHRLVATGLRQHVGVVVSKDDVERPKPAPDPFQEACRRLGTPAARTVGVEDSTHGVRSARDAGLAVLAVAREHVGAEHLGAAHLVVTALDLAAIAEVLARRLGGAPASARDGGPGRLG
jgi:HAD superfamily hydrolase (TIGR01509 family)